MTLLPRRVLAAALAVAAVAATQAGTQAQAATLHATSSNWAGYAVRRTDVQFKRVSGAWTVPAVDCSTAPNTFSANWVGLGGFATDSQALEQLGTESDCSASGKATYMAWFEVVPAAATKARITVRPGDQVFASVTVDGSLVRLTIANRTRGTKDTKSIRPATVDLTSAEWILEAPSLCFGSTTSDCRQTALADFTTTGFSGARATTTGGHAGSILDQAWNAIAITLSGGSGFGRGPAGDGGPPGSGRPAEVGSSGASATPAPVSPDGASFSVAFEPGT